MGMDTTTWDCIVVGGGAAGLSAALVLGRARRRTLLLDDGHQSNLAAHGIGGLLGQDGRPAHDFYADGHAELAKYPAVRVLAARATAAVAAPDHHGPAFTITLDGGEEHSARTLLLATGMSYRYPDMPGIAERFGKSVFHCPFCHGWEVQGGQLGVLDGGTTGAARALLLRAWSDDVTLLTDGPANLAAEDAARLAQAGVTIDERRIAGLQGPGEHLEAVAFVDGATRPLTGALVAVTLAQRGGLAEQLGAELANAGGHWAESLRVDGMQQTPVPGVWAAGDTVAAAPSVAAAIASGSLAAAAIVHSLTSLLARPDDVAHADAAISV
ncbi:MAG: NAD(P)/FAD-dependent oxidoreductase [Solirubrobacteraceae bacterium]|nr:NAD(P)/FAD-dependent oxidoreductase [Solirubrobacteraceae bacterium]